MLDINVSYINKNKSESDLSPQGQTGINMHMIYGRTAILVKRSCNGSSDPRFAPDTAEAELLSVTDFLGTTINL
mgnify:CR=1 FL=1